MLAGQSPYTDYFVEADPTADLSRVTRPRSTPLLTPVLTAAGQRHRLDHVQRRPGRPQLGEPRRAAGDARRPVPVRRARRPHHSPRRDRLPLEACRNVLHSLERNPRRRQVDTHVAGCRRTRHAPPDRDERAASRERQLLRRRRRSPPGLPVQPAAAGARSVPRTAMPAT